MDSKTHMFFPLFKGLCKNQTLHINRPAFKKDQTFNVLAIWKPKKKVDAGLQAFG